MRMVLVMLANSIVIKIVSLMVLITVFILPILIKEISTVMESEMLAITVGYIILISSISIRQRLEMFAKLRMNIIRHMIVIVIKS